MLFPSLSSAALPLLLLPLSASAGYFDGAVKPGQAAKDFAASAPSSLGAKPLSTGPLNPIETAKKIGEGVLDAINQALYNGVGIDVKGMMANSSRALAFTKEEDDADGVVRLTDLNFDDEITYEEIEEGKERVWCILV